MSYQVCNGNVVENASKTCSPCSSGEVCDYNYLRHPGWDQQNYCFKSLYSPATLNLIQRKVMELTLGVDGKNRKIIVPKERICEVLDGVYQSYTPPVGDIYTRYIIPTDEQQDRVQALIDQTIQIIVSNVRDTLGIEQNNQKLSAWVQVYGDFNAQGLRAHSIITTRDRKPTTMQFNMNY